VRTQCLTVSCPRLGIRSFSPTVASPPLCTCLPELNIIQIHAVMKRRPSWLWQFTHLVHPQPHRLRRLSQALRRHQHDALHHPREVAEVEKVVRLCRRREELLKDHAVERGRGANKFLSKHTKRCVVPVRRAEVRMKKHMRHKSSDRR
jgi:hypothetical protein